MTEFEIERGQLVAGTPYRVIRLVGTGGMGSVYEVEHDELGKRFMLKALRRGLSSRKDLARRLRNEWRALGRLEDPNIVSVTDAGVTPTGHPFFVMERLVGETLAARLKKGRPFQMLEALHVAVQVLDGLHAAHGIGIVHRDVKPPNVFLVEGGGVKLLDFGIAKTLDSGAHPITARGVAVGTPRYMAPEQAAGAEVDVRTDLYAVGLVLFEMLTGRGPFDDIEDPNKLFLAHMSRAAPRASTFAPGVPPDLDQLLGVVLAKKPERRPQSAAWLAASLREIASRLAARPSTPPLPDWIHTGPTVPGSPLSVEHDGAALPGDVTRTQIVGDDEPDSARRGTTEVPGGALATRRGPPTGDAALAAPDTLTMTHAADARGEAGADEAETRTADIAEPVRDRTAPPVETGAAPRPSLVSPRSRRRLLTAAAIAGLSTTIVAAFVAGQLARSAAGAARGGGALAASPAGAQAVPAVSGAPVVLRPLADDVAAVTTGRARAVDAAAAERSVSPTLAAPRPTPLRAAAVPHRAAADATSGPRPAATPSPVASGAAPAKIAAPAPRAEPASVASSLPNSGL